MLPELMAPLVSNTLRDWRRATVGWAVGLAAFAPMYLGS
jgi:hypothetical protein